jgi:hypothetical protein
MIIGRYREHSSSVGGSVVRKASLVALLVVWSGCAGPTDPGIDAGPCNGADVDAGPVGPAADATMVGVVDSASTEPDALEASMDALVEDAADDTTGHVTKDATSDAVGDRTPIADALAESAATAPDAAGHCTDGRQDFDESDVDCGGSCPPCGPSKVCFADSDCSPTASGCDADAGGCYCVARALVCVYSHCLDHKTDADETDLDCGGSVCSPCASGLRCLVDSDCEGSACDSLSNLCVSNQCADRHQDGSESDVDCGGGICGSCTTGQHCNSNLDCQSGHLCVGDGGAAVCQ